MTYIPRKLKTHTCKTCGIEYKGRHNQIYCTVNCTPSRLRIEPTGLNYLKNGVVGAISELLVCVDLMKKGYDVFRAISQHSDCDAVAIKGDILLKLQIRTGKYYRKDDGTVTLAYAKKLIEGKQVAVVTIPDNNIHYIDFQP